MAERIFTWPARSSTGKLADHNLYSSHEIVLVRVDDRLIHGQILEAWVPFLKASSIIIANDEVASDFFRETVMRMAVPSDTEVIVRSIDEFSENYPYSQTRGKRTLVLFSCISDAVRAYESGFHFHHLNIGNVYSERCAMTCLPSILLGTRDIDHLKVLMKNDVTVELRRIPRERSSDLRNFLKIQKP